MVTMLEQIVIGIVVIAAVAYVLSMLFRSAKGQSGCSSCSSCSSINRCSSRLEEVEDEQTAAADRQADTETGRDDAERDETAP